MATQLPCLHALVYNQNLVYSDYVCSCKSHWSINAVFSLFYYLLFLFLSAQYCAIVNKQSFSHACLILMGFEWITVFQAKQLNQFRWQNNAKLLWYLLELDSCSHILSFCVFVFGSACDFWRSCDTEDWSNDAENTALITEINYTLLYMQLF